MPRIFSSISLLPAVTISDPQCVMSRTDTDDAVLTAVKFNHERSLWYCQLCLLMPDHLHAIIAFPREPGMETTVKNWKRFVAGNQWRGLATRFFRSPLARPSRTRRENSYIVMIRFAWDCASERRIGCGFIDLTTVRRRVGRAGSPLHAVSVCDSEGGAHRSDRPTNAS